MSKSNDRLYSISTNSMGTKMKLIEYKNARNIIVEFQDDYKYKTCTTYEMFIKGKVKNPYDRSVYNIGYLGEGKYSSVTHPPLYYSWHDMLKRCYDTNERTRIRYMSYNDCKVDDEFLNLQKFGEWYEENIYFVDKERMHLDKDILYKGNRIYCKERCIFVPNRVNVLFTKRQYYRGDCPIGVRYNDSGKYEAYCHIINSKSFGENKYLGTFDSKIEAFNAYKSYKEKYIKQVADEYIDKIPGKLYDALYNYKVEIND